MGQSTRENGLTTKPVVKVGLNTQTVIFTRVNGEMIKQMAMES